MNKTPVQPDAPVVKGGLPFKKAKRSPFDRLGAKQWQPQKGQMSKGYA